MLKLRLFVVSLLVAVESAAAGIILLVDAKLDFSFELQPLVCVLVDGAVRRIRVRHLRIAPLAVRPLQLTPRLLNRLKYLGLQVLVRLGLRLHAQLLETPHLFFVRVVVVLPRLHGVVVLTLFVCNCDLFVQTFVVDLQFPHSVFYQLFF